MEALLEKLLSLVFKYGLLAFDALKTFLAARTGKLTEAEVEAEIERIQRQESEDIAADWQKVNS